MTEPAPGDPLQEAEQSRAHALVLGAYVQLSGASAPAEFSESLFESIGETREWVNRLLTSVSTERLEDILTRCRSDFANATDVSFSQFVARVAQYCARREWEDSLKRGRVPPAGALTRSDVLAIASWLAVLWWHAAVFLAYSAGDLVWPWFLLAVLLDLRVLWIHRTLRSKGYAWVGLVRCAGLVFNRVSRLPPESELAVTPIYRPGDFECLVSVLERTAGQTTEEKLPPPPP